MKCFLPLLIILPLTIWVGCEEDGEESVINEEIVEYFPTGGIVSPSTATVGRTVNVSIEASDELGIDRVEIFINDNLILNDNEEPFEYLWNTVLDGEGQYKIKAVIHNLDGNYISDSINVEVVITNLFIPQDFSDLSNEEIFEYLDSGDTISVSSGTYNCNYLNFTNYPNLNFIGLDGAENVILDGGGQGRVLAVSQSLVQGFTIQNGLATDNGGGGILLYGSILRNCIVRNNVCSWSAYSRGGGGIEAIYTCIIEDNIIYGNQCEYVGGGLHIGEGSTVTVINNVFYNNSVISGWGGGIYIHMAQATVYNNIFVSSDLVSHNNNDFGPADYNLGIDFGSNDIPFASPNFVNINQYDFHLSDSSPCVDTGNPDAQYNDVDGTRNDMGAYGGPNGTW